MKRKHNVGIMPLFMQVLNRPKLEYLLVSDIYLDFWSRIQQLMMFLLQFVKTIDYWFHADKKSHGIMVSWCNDHILRENFLGYENADHS